ncbi:MAG: transposase [bacterium]|nr:transposase [bacterium]MDZ4284376.1 transposase [Patescibacteria group bacterium]
MTLHSDQKRTSYPTDINDATWQRIEPLIPVARSNKVVGGRARSTDIREVVNALVYREHVQCPWRLLPHDFPHWQVVRHYYTAWEHMGRWQRILKTLTRPGTTP